MCSLLTLTSQGKEANLDDHQFYTMADLERYAENTASSLLYLQLEAMGLKDVHADHAATHAGKAIGMSTMIRGTPMHVQNRHFFLPADVCAKHQLSSEMVFRQGPDTPIADVVFDVATHARQHLLEAKSLAKDLPKTAIPALLPATHDIALV
ncbi:NADH dehydrogenase (ubiquinone) complex I, assembly factor 6 [Quaeritorhiza haematococci]|nr:NADH dehydrogenase (ubiquinone) complex I, assembly factor 6 [Quaeritorhiza haematococci]